MKISIITPSFNQGKFIEDAILSVLGQNYPDVEHIVIDNCSGDNTQDVVKKYPHIKWISEPDKGQSDALNKGFRMATGDVIGWLNCDDLYAPDALSKVISAFENNSESQWLIGRCNMIDPAGNLIRRDVMDYKNRLLDRFSPRSLLRR